MQLPPSVAIRCLLALAVTLLIAGCGRGSPPRAVTTADPPTTRAGGPTKTTGVLVDIAGHVRRPGVYRVAADARVHDVIEAAGGARPGAALASLNRAAPVVDGQQVVVPGPGGAAAATGATTAAGAVGPGGRVSLNSADVAALDALPGIGPVTAQHIVDDRTANGPFASVDDLDRVSGIGPATVDALREVAGP